MSLPGRRIIPLVRREPRFRGLVIEWEPWSAREPRLPPELLALHEMVRAAESLDYHLAPEVRDLALAEMRRRVSRGAALAARRRAAVAQVRERARMREAGA